HGGCGTGQTARGSVQTAADRSVGCSELELRAHHGACNLLAPWCSAKAVRSACAGKQVNDMNKHRHLPHLSLLVGFLMMTATAAARQSAAAGQSNTAGSPFNTTFGPFNTTSSPFNPASSPFSATAGQIKTATPGDPAERQPSRDQKFREWSLDANVADDVKRIKVCRVEDVCKMRFK